MTIYSVSCEETKIISGHVLLVKIKEKVYLNLGLQMLLVIPTKSISLFCVPTHKLYCTKIIGTQIVEKSWSFYVFVDNLTHVMIFNINFLIFFPSAGTESMFCCVER